MVMILVGPMQDGCVKGETCTGMGSTHCPVTHCPVTHYCLHLAVTP